MLLQEASRKNVKIKMAIQSPSGAGKTYSALLLAYGLCGNWKKIGLIDTENHSSELYAHLGKFQVLHLSQPFTPERYVEAIIICESKGMEVIIVDSISHEWDGLGGLLEIHANMAGNSYTNWGKLTPRHNDFVQHMLQSPAHIIGTIRSKQDYVLSEKNGKQVPEKVGLKGITRDGMDYEFTLVLELDMKHHASVSKDRTSLFTGKPDFIISSDTGKKILDWCNEGEPLPKIDLVKRINECKSITELLQLYYDHPPKDAEEKSQFTKRRGELEQKQIPAELTNTLKLQTNGVYSQE